MHSKKIILLFTELLDINIWYEKTIYWFAMINKIKFIGKPISLVVSPFLRVIYNCDISLNATIGRHVKFPHAVGIVIGGTAIIGKETIIMPNVVIGAKHYPPNGKKRHATIGENCLIGANAVIIGNIKIGDNCIIAAGTTVLEDLGADSKYYGI